MLELYIANKNYSSWSLRPWLLMKAHSIPFAEQLVPFKESGNYERFRTFSPNGLVPCLHDGNTRVWDSLAIVEYLAEQHPQLWPSDPTARAWARSATAEMHAGFSALRNNCSMNCGLRIELHSISPALQNDLDRLDELWSEGIQRFGGPFLASDKLTAVDAFFAPVAFRIQSFGLMLGDTAMAYTQRLLSLDHMQHWYQDALNETWREPQHDAETLAAGRLVEDLRSN